MTLPDGAYLSTPVGERDHVLGPASAPATLVEYGDYECPFCGAAHPIVKELLRQRGDQVRFVYRHFPLTRVHPHAERAAEAAEAAGAQGRFWQMHDQLFEHQNALADPYLLAYATAIGLDLDRFALELANRVHLGRVRKDFKSGVRSGVNGTPTFFVNGRRHDSTHDLETLLSAIGAAIDSTRRRSA